MTENPADVPPGVVAFLLGNCKYSPEVVSRCLLELAAEGAVRLDPPPGAPLVGLTGSRPRSGRDLLPYEDIIVWRVAERGRQAAVPLPVLLGDDGDDYKRWKKHLTDALESQVKERGLAKLRAGRAAWRIVLAVILGTLAATIAGYQVKASVGKVLLGVELYASLLILIVPLALRRWRLTEKGAEVAAWWRHRLAAAGGTEQAQARLPRGHVWSQAGGHWHPVRIGRVPAPPQWGTRGALGGLILWTVIGVVFFGFFRRHGRQRRDTRRDVRRGDTRCRGDGRDRRLLAARPRAADELARQRDVHRPGGEVLGH